MTSIRRNTPKAFKPVNGPAAQPQKPTAPAPAPRPASAPERTAEARKPALASTVAATRESAQADRSSQARVRARLEPTGPSNDAALRLLEQSMDTRPMPGPTPDIGGPIRRPLDPALARAWDRARPIIGPLARGLGDSMVRWLPRPPKADPAAERAAKDAVARGEALLHGADTDKASGVPEAEVIRDPAEANRESEELQAKAAVEVKANADLEAQKLARLSAADRAKYDAVARTCADDPAARLSLQMMLFDGRLPGSTPSAGGENLLSELHRTATEPVADGIDRDSLVSDMVQEIYDPASISQKGKGTCAATSTMISVARDDPAEYARLVRGLASPEGRVTMRNGDSIRREEGTAHDDGSQRTQSERLLAATLMEYGKKWLGYSNDSDTHFGGGSGLSVDDTDRILQGLTGKKWDARTASNDDKARELAKDMEEALEDGGAVLAGLDWGAADSGKTHGRHKVLVTGMTDDTVTYINPWGQEERMPRDEFERRLNNANLPAD
jgi:hypothetical protein